MDNSRNRSAPAPEKADATPRPDLKAGLRGSIGVWGEAQTPAVQARGLGAEPRENILVFSCAFALLGGSISIKISIRSLSVFVIL
jgi:hypothetical protein